jgi:hypothetical protein
MPIICLSSTRGPWVCEPTTKLPIGAAWMGRRWAGGTKNAWDCSSKDSN